MAGPNFYCRILQPPLDEARGPKELRVQEFEGSSFGDLLCKETLITVGADM
jgi:hypothetical protein